MNRQSTAASDAAVSGRAGRAVASFASYPDAERAVDYLSDHQFPVEHVSIVGRDLKLVEQVTGRVTWWRATLQGAAAGALAGALIGWLFWVFDWFAPIVAAGWLIVDGLWFGAVVGALFGLLTHLLLRGPRDFATVGAMVADRYDVVVDQPVADEAARLLAGMAGAAEADERFARDAAGTADATPPAPSGGAR